MRTEKQSIQKNKRAPAILASWLTATDIPYDRVDEQTFAISAPNRKRKVKVVLSDVPIKRVFCVDPAKIASRYDDIAIGAFHEITKKLGFGAPIPVDRGEEPKKVLYKRDLDLVLFRHREFRRAPNPPAHKIRQYRPTVTRVTRTFFARNKKLWLSQGYDSEDLETYALAWTCNFIHKYEQYSEFEDNEKLLASHLKQRFVEMYKIVTKYLDAKGKEYTNDYRTSYQEDDLQDSYMFDVFSSQFHLEPRHTKKSSPKQRKEARSTLEEELQGLDDDQLVFILEAIEESEHLDDGLRKEARRRLNTLKTSDISCVGETAQPT